MPSEIELFHTGDLHFGACRRVHEYMHRIDCVCEGILAVVDASKAKHKVVVVAGDLMDGKHPTEEERCRALRFVLDLVHRRIHVVMTNGNHDFVNEDGVTMLDIFIQIQRLESKYLHIVTNNPGVVDIQGIEASFLCVPCRQNLTTSKLKKILSGLKSKAKHKLCYGVVHEAINGSISSDTHTMKTDCDAPEIDGIRGLMLGDIHKCQKVGNRAWYCGSPYQTKFNEDKHKGLLVWRPENDDPELVLLRGVPKLIETSDAKELKKYENTKHTVHYVGTEHPEIDSPNITVHPNLKLVRESTTVARVVEETRHSALLGLKEHLKHDGLSEDEIEEGYADAEKELAR